MLEIVPEREEGGGGSGAASRAPAECLLGSAITWQLLTDKGETVDVLPPPEAPETPPLAHRQTHKDPTQARENLKPNCSLADLLHRQISGL